MPDITMCNGQGCELKSTCYRYTATPSKHVQSYFTEPPIKNGKCEYYWQDAKERAKNLMKLKKGYNEKTKTKNS